MKNSALHAIGVFCTTLFIVMLVGLANKAIAADDTPESIARDARMRSEENRQFAADYATLLTAFSTNQKFTTDVLALAKTKNLTGIDALIGSTVKTRTAFHVDYVDADFCICVSADGEYGSGSGCVGTTCPKKIVKKKSGKKK